MTIQQIKLQLSIPQLLQNYNLTPNKNKLILCPFHDDKNPSMQINEDFYYCHGCGKKGDIIDWVQEIENYTTKEAIEKCKTFIDIIPNSNTLKPIIMNENFTELFEKFNQCFLKTPKAFEYAKSRNLSPEQMQIGYNDGKLYPKLKYCLIFPLRSQSGDIVSFYGRSINETAQSKHFYLTNREGLYPRYPNPQTKILILTEAVIDALTLEMALYSIGNALHSQYEVLVCYGVNGLTPEHLQAIQNLSNLEEIIFFFDGDAPGEEAVIKYAKQLTIDNEQLIISQVQTPQNEDINSLLQGHSSDIISHLLENRILISPKSKVEGQKSTNNQINPFLYQNEHLKLQVLGKIESKEASAMRVTLVAYNLQKEDFPSRQNLNLYNDDQVEKVIRKIAEKIAIGTTILNQAIQKLILQLEEYRDNQSEKPQMKERHQVRILTQTENIETLEILKSENLKEELIQMLEQTGLVGEGKNALFLYLILLSHKMHKTLHAVVQGTSGSGKSHLVSGVADCMFDQNKIKRFTRVTDKSFYNYGEYDLVNTGIILEDYDGLSEEAQLAWRELQSNEKLSSSVSQKNEQTGEIKTGEKYVFGPIASLVATTKFRMYEDNESRVFIIAIDESEAQTERVLDYMAKKSAGIITKDFEKSIKQKLQNIAYHLQPYHVKNPYRLELPKNVKHRRRLTQMLHDFVAQVTILNQFQREKDPNNYLITEIQDLEISVDLMFNSIVIKADELDGILRQFYENLKIYVEKKAKTINKKTADVEFTMREVRQHFNVSKSQMHRYFVELTELEYLHKSNIGSRNIQSFQISYWDNIERIRTEIQQYLQAQIQAIKETPKS